MTFKYMFIFNKIKKKLGLVELFNVKIIREVYTKKYFKALTKIINYV